MTTQLPRGIRDNNPGNIRFDGTQWEGITGNDGTFCIFNTPENGIRAMARILRNYGKCGIRSLASIITTWAPPSENNTAAYIAAVCDQCKSQPDTLLTEANFSDVVKSMIHHENGQQPYTDSQINAGISASA
jgi:hypothetical protein